MRGRCTTCAGSRSARPSATRRGARALDGIHWIRRRRGRKLASDAMYHLLALHAADEDPYKQEVDPDLQQMALQDEDNWL